MALSESWPYKLPNAWTRPDYLEHLRSMSCDGKSACHVATAKNGQEAN